MSIGVWTSSNEIFRFVCSYNANNIKIQPTITTSYKGDKSKNHNKKKKRFLKYIKFWFLTAELWSESSEKKENKTF